MTTYRVTVMDPDGDVLMTVNLPRRLEPGDLVTLPDGTQALVTTASSMSPGHDPEPEVVRVLLPDAGREPEAP